MNTRTWLFMVAAWTSGCEGGMMLEDDAGMSTRAMVQGSVTYDGAEDGSLLIGLWAWDDAMPSTPTGPPVDFLPIDTPSFPHVYELPSVRPGEYFLGAVLDVGRDSPTFPGEEDIVIYGSRLELTAGDEVAVDLVLPAE